MEKPAVAALRYDTPFSSVEKAVSLSNAFRLMPKGAKVFVKPNIVFWTRAVAFPKWGVITTSRVIEDVVKLLKDMGASAITIGEGVVVSDPKDTATPAHAFDSLGYTEMGKRYGVKAVNVMERPFKKAEVAPGITLNYSADILDADFVVSVPVMKTHNQTMVSLSIKNIKGTIDIKSRKQCHSANPDTDLHWYVARLSDPLPPTASVIDGLYTLERGPAFDGKVKRENIIVASSDPLSADLVGARILGFNPADVPHLAHAAKNRSRTASLDSLNLKGEPVESLQSPHEYDFAYQSDDSGEMPVPLAKQGIKGLFYRKFDLSMCTYCSGLNGLLLTAIRAAYKGTPFDRVEVLTGKMMKPAPDMNATILVGQCMVKEHRKNPDIKNPILIKGCPPDPKEVVEALHKAGIAVDQTLFDNMDKLPAFFMGRYTGKPEFDEALFQAGK
ncbi:MAG: DUF362 domain-containing protein [Thermodesulfobacteriota bacterium]